MGRNGVASRFVGLGLQGEPRRVATIADVAAQEVDRLAIPGQRVERRLGGDGFGSLSTTPEDVDRSPEFGPRSIAFIVFWMA